MSVDLSVEIIRQAIMVGLVIAAPMLLTALIVGILVSLFQAVTQIQEQTLTFIPKLLLVAFVFVMSLPWIVTKMVEYLVGTIRSLSGLVG
jgi:flagellar biosynthesis protein FliQ